MGNGELIFRQREHESGMIQLELENSELAVALLPEKGGDVYHIRHKNKDVDILFRTPWGINKPGSRASGGDSFQQWLDCYPGGWQVMFPNAGSECSYRGAFHNFHGEASVVPWSYNVLTHNEELLEIGLTAQVTRTPFQIERIWSMRAGEGRLSLREKISNNGFTEMDYLWGQHIAFGEPFLSEDCELQIPARTIICSEYQGEVSHRLPSGEVMAWPNIQLRSGERVDYSLIPPPESRTSDMAYLTELEQGIYTLYNRKLNLSARVLWDAEVFPSVWLWQEFGGIQDYPFYGRCYVMGVEPNMVPTSAGLSECAKKGMSAKLAAGASRETMLSIEVFEGN